MIGVLFAAFLVFMLIYSSPNDGSLDEYRAQGTESKIQSWIKRYGVIVVALWLFSVLFQGAGTALLTGGQSKSPMG